MPPTVRNLNRDEWLALSPRFRDHSYRQSWAYSEALASRRAAEMHAVAIEDGDALLGLANVRVKRVPGVGGGVAFISGGPLIEQDAAADSALDACLDALQAEYVERCACTLRVVVPVRSADTWSSMQPKFEERGFTIAPDARQYRTFLLNIDRPEADLRAGLKGKWRNNLKKGEAAGLRVETGDDPALIRTFATIYREVRERKGFDSDLDASFYESVQEAADPAERNHIMLAWAGDELAAGFVWGMHGDTCVSILSATGSAGRDTRASYLLRWEGLREARRRGMTLYDLGGVDEDENPGVFSFKQGMGGDEVVAPGPNECVAGSLRGRVARLAEKAYRRVKGG